jgi:hypothetical protein
MRTYTVAAISTTLLASTVLMLPSPSLAGECNINAKSITGTYGFATSGEAFANNALSLPIGKFSQAGTLTQSNVIKVGSTLRGNWNVSVQQLYQTGQAVTLTFRGNFVVSKETCTGQLFIDGINSPAFFTIYVDQGNEQRTTSLVPGIVVSYPSSKKISNNN